MRFLKSYFKGHEDFIAFKYTAHTKYFNSFSQLTSHHLHRGMEQTRTSNGTFMKY